MQQVTVGPKYQIVIPKDVRRKMKGLKPGARVSIHPIDTNKLSVQIDPGDWINRTSGMMTEAWKDIDPIVELEKMRNEWEERMQELEKDSK